MAWLAAVTGEAAKFSTEVVHGHYRANLEPSITIKANGKLGYTPKDFPAAFYLSVTTCSRTWFISPENFLFRNSSDISPSWERKREVSASISTEVFSFLSFFLEGREKLKRYKRGIKTSPRINVIQKRCWKAWRLKVLIELSRWEFFFFFFEVLQRIIRLMLSTNFIEKRLCRYIPSKWVHSLGAAVPPRCIFRYNQTSRVVAFVPRSNGNTTARYPICFRSRSPLFVINIVQSTKLQLEKKIIIINR